MYVASQTCNCTVSSSKGQNIVHVLLIHKILYKVGLTLIYNVSLTCLFFDKGGMLHMVLPKIFHCHL